MTVVKINNLLALHHIPPIVELMFTILFSGLESLGFTFEAHHRYPHAEQSKLIACLST
ncbi:hypothetical protein D8674_023729 [Pyrus ussuriensis x Pyrus communis]|uniref:Uncharacterized protein n=1 Tax=Pyrus ussuriensis x Pyrus communis TaxID=2448454 RepID=A0A5N5H2U6_9ROSA|nr:hypothetical protein D8674_023729 [Pyrus ussuriensis x Pyrus communis]